MTALLSNNADQCCETLVMEQPVKIRSYDAIVILTDDQTEFDRNAAWWGKLWHAPTR
jgi:hypothetical protein